MDGVVFRRRGERFSSRLIRGVAKRCVHGFPQVLLCEPVMDMKPFPTSFWLVCPHLLPLLGRLESAGGVPEMEAASVGRRKPWEEYHIEHALLRLSMIRSAERAFLRRYKSVIFRALSCRGIGGISTRWRDDDFPGDRTSFVKCLHLQAASFLALRRHPMAEWLSARIEEWECSDALCAHAK
ncbi:MAG: DUF501 domain-containing protein [Synergistaceae bacterium]|jgi:hypothetical protein|nr:DUF501 domain-containing protein [Synergistaceae bacterium]